MQSKATTVQQYLAELPPDRRAAIQAVREVILKNLDGGYEEGMQYGMIGYFVPHRLYPAGYHCDPKTALPFASLSSQKNHMGFGIMSNYLNSPEDRWFRSAWKKTGKKLDMGACCVRFKKLDDVALDVLGESIRRMPVKKYVALYESMLATRAKGAKKRPAGVPAATTKAKARKPATARAAAKPAPRGKALKARGAGAGR
jgi:hypothetical protein